MSSSSSSSVMADQLLDKIINTNTDKPGFEDLKRLIQQMEEVVAHYAAQPQEKSPVREKWSDLRPSASGASNFVEQVATIAEEIKKYFGNIHETIIEMLNAIGRIIGRILLVEKISLVVVSVVVAISEIVDTSKHNEECLRRLKSMVDLSKKICQLEEFHSHEVLQYILKGSILLIVKGAILCCSNLKQKRYERILNVGAKQKLQQLDRDMKDIQVKIDSQTITSNFRRGQNKDIPPPRVPPANKDAVGIEEKIDKVIKKLDWESDSNRVAVIIYGIGGSGKTTLANSVYSSLNEKLQDWKHSRITLIENLEKDPKVKDLQSLILQDLTGTKQDIRDFQTGGQILRDIIEKESVFLYIDNALYLEPLRNLLPKDVTNAKKFRLLVTARETNVSGITESCGVESCKLHDVESLPIDVAIQVLCKQTDRNRDSESILQERPQAQNIAKICCCCPLFLEVIGAYLHQRKNIVGAYDKVLHQWLKLGDKFGGNKKYNLDESRILFSYNEIEQSAKEAFLDICSFSYSWSWEEVAWIVGEEEMVCLQEAALIKRESEIIKIHDLILLAAQNKSKDNRFKNVKDVSLTLKNKKLASQIKGIWLKRLDRPLHISAEELDAMSQSLRVFYLGSNAQGLTIMKGKCSKQFDELRFLHVERGVSNLPMNIFNLNQLRYLSINNLEEDVVLSPSMNLPNLIVLKLNGSRIHGLAEIRHLRSLKRLDLVRCNADGISECFLNLHRLQWLKLSECGVEELPESLFKLQSLQKLDLKECRNLKRLPDIFGELVNLTELNLSHCSSLQGLPRDLEKLTSLQSLSIRGCRSLLFLPPGLEKLTSLLSLDIEGCSSLRCLPHGLMSVWGSEIDFNGCSSLSEISEEICEQKLLTSISLYDCRELKTLPSRFGELTCLQHLDLRECGSIQELCNDFHCLGRLKSLNLGKCKSLSSLPQDFGNLSVLETLDLRYCRSLSSLPQGFGNLSALETLDLRYCSSLSSLPQGFGNLSALETLDLSGCDKLEELGSDFHCQLVALKYLHLFKCDNLRNLPDFRCLVALKYLDLSECDNLRNLPDHFGELSCLESLYLSGCSNLVKLSEDFHILQSLTILDLSDCKNLGAEWMDCVVNMRGLWRLDIVGSERLIQRWMEMKSQKERNLVVVTDFPQGEEGERALLLEAVLSKVFDEKELLVGADGHPFHSSSLQRQTPLILIVDINGGRDSRELHLLQRTSKDLQIIYVGTRFDSLNSESAVRMLAYTPDNSRTSSFCLKLSSCSRAHGIAVFRSTDQLEENGLKCFSAWEDISEIEQLALLASTPSGSNMELLNELLVTEETDYLLLNGNSQVKVAALQGKLILLLVTEVEEDLRLRISAVKEMYLKLQESHYVVELVWIPIPRYDTSWEDFERAAANALWPVVPNPWLIEDRICSFLGYKLKMPCVCVVDEKGRILKKDAMAMIERWGMEAYPFSEAREEEVRKAAWEGFKVNSLTTLQFVLQNLELLSSKTQEMIDRGAVILFCVGTPEKMMELVPHLNSVLTKSKMELQVFYVARSSYIIEKYYDMAREKLKENESEMCGIATLSFSDINRFWRRVKHLQNELDGVGIDEKIMKVRTMVLGLTSADSNYESSYGKIAMLLGLTSPEYSNYESPYAEKAAMALGLTSADSNYESPYGEKIGMVIVDGNGEMVSGRELCDDDEESKEKLVEEIKRGGVDKRRWRDGTCNALMQVSYINTPLQYLCSFPYDSTLHPSTLNHRDPSALFNSRHPLEFGTRHPSALCILRYSTCGNHRHPSTPLGTRHPSALGTQHSIPFGTQHSLTLNLRHPTFGIL